MEKFGSSLSVGCDVESSSPRPDDHDEVASEPEPSYGKSHGKVQQGSSSTLGSPEKTLKYSTSDSHLHKHSKHARSKSADLNRTVSQLSQSPRLVVVSSKIKNIPVLQNALLPNVSLLTYKYESSSVESLIGKWLQGLKLHLGQTVFFYLYEPLFEPLFLTFWISNL